MQNLLKIITFGIITILVLLMLKSCANVQAPSGGKRDTIAPKILNFYPENYTANFNLSNDNEIKLEFDKYMDKGKVIENIFISPELNLSYNWSGKELSISINDSLKRNTTYNLTMGRDIADYLGNKAAEIFNLTFSTGEIIDKGIIRGKLIDEFGTTLKDNKNIFIFAYFLGKEDYSLIKQNDSKDTIFKFPDYRTQINDDGSFEVKGLKYGYYAVFAIEDKLRDKSFDLGIDRIALPQNYIFVNDSLVGKCFIKMCKLTDITKPSIISAELKNKYQISKDKTDFLYRLEVASTEAINPKNIGKYSFIIQKDSVTSFFPFSAFINSKDKSKIDILIDSKIDAKLDTGIVYKVIALTKSNLPKFIDLISKESTIKNLTDYNEYLKNYTVCDTSNNYLIDTVNFALFKLDTKMKSVLLNVKLEESIKDSSQSINSDFEYNFLSEFKLNGELKNTNKNFIQLYNSKQIKDISENLELNHISENSIKIKTKKPLNLDNWYELSYNLKDVFDYSFSSDTAIVKDTVISFKFKTNKSEKFSEVSGTFNDLTLDTSNNTKLDYIVKFTNKEKKVNYSILAKNGEKWKLEKVVAGTYDIEVIKDRNSNGIYDFGEYTHYGIAGFSEPFMTLEQKVVVKENWSMEDVFIKVKF